MAPDGGCAPSSLSSFYSNACKRLNQSLSPVLDSSAYGILTSRLGENPQDTGALGSFGTAAAQLNDVLGTSDFLCVLGDLGGVNVIYTHKHFIIASTILSSTLQHVW